MMRADKMLLRANLEFILTELQRRLGETVQIALMLPRATGWYTAADVGLTDAQRWVEFDTDSDGLAWLSLAFLYREPVWMSLHEALLRDMLHDPRDYACFKDITAVAVLPIYYSDLPIGMVVIYTSSAELMERLPLKQVSGEFTALLAPLIEIANRPPFWLRLLSMLRRPTSPERATAQFREILAKHGVIPQIAKTELDTFKPFNPLDGATVEVNALHLEKDRAWAQQLRDQILQRRQQLHGTFDATDRARLTQILRALEAQEHDLQKQAELAKELLRRDDDTAQV
jgi:hypothetical protein